MEINQGFNNQVDRYRKRILERASSQWNKWLKALIIISVILGSALFGWAATKVNPLYIVIVSTGFILIAGVELVLRNQEWNPVFILFAALFIPFSLPTGTDSRLVISLLLTLAIVGLWIIRMAVQDKGFHLRSSNLNKPLLLFMGVVVLSIVWSIIFRDPLVFTPSKFIVVQIASAIVMIMLPAVFLLMGNFVENIKVLKVMVALFLLAGILGIISLFVNFSLPINMGGMFSLWIMAISYGMALFDRRLHWLSRGALLLLTVIWFYYRFVIDVSWLAGWLPGMIAIGGISFMRSKKLGFILGIIAIVFLITQTNYVDRVFKAEEAQSGVTRLSAWQSNWRITKDHLLLGTGPAGYAVYYMSYFPNDAMATHSNYIDILAQTGVIGFVLILWFFIALAWKGYKLTQRFKGRGDFIEAVANFSFAGTIACIIIMGFGDWLFPFAYTQTIAGYNYAVYNWLFMGMILVIERLAENAPGEALV